ncbi:hypothetical protein HX837_05945 [Marine Group I thaumarchaeote]|uniref:Uncharacterized protein n=1 Tax=Marine Group I thaumarchaeote TaxID=2511932 RepID=A0A7K4MR44_9ARCH|nr:hypothetical protein [Marine Group I thaumarchaeote]NWJ68399.1 hypothetical protein [Marine Group I thaumarchaeote]
MLTTPRVEIRGYVWFSWLEWKCGGMFGLLTSVKDVIHAWNGKRGVF